MDCLHVDANVVTVPGVRRVPVRVPERIELHADGRRRGVRQPRMGEESEERATGVRRLARRERPDDERHAVPPGGAVAIDGEREARAEGLKLAALPVQ